MERVVLEKKLRVFTDNYKGHGSSSDFLHHSRYDFVLVKLLLLSVN